MRLIDADELLKEWRLECGGSCYISKDRYCMHYDRTKGICTLIIKAPTIEAEPTYEQLEEYCRKRCLVVVDGALFNEMESRWSAEPVKRGQWTVTEKGAKITAYKCSECGRVVWDDTGYDVSKDYPYCHCGAKMDGGENESC